LQALGIGTSGVGGFITNALGGNAISGLIDLGSSLITGEGGGHSVFYNMGQGVVAGPTQGFGAAFGSSIEGTPWASGPADVATASITGGALTQLLEAERLFKPSTVPQVSHLLVQMPPKTSPLERVFSN
jgi:hypothetical protein